MPASTAAYVAQLNPGGALPAGLALQWIEIAPLLAFQFTVDKNRSQAKCHPLSHAPTEQELLALALPIAPDVEQFQTFQGPRSVILKARSLNVRWMLEGMINAQLANGAQGTYLGIEIGTGSPHVNVVRFNGRCYLNNGYHRCLGAALAGATHIPCVLRDVANPGELLFFNNPGTFGLQLLESANPPTLGHFAQGRAYDVTLKEFWRFINVSWSEYGIPID
jgi:hypothetical protein